MRPANCAFLYAPEAFETNKPGMMGRQSAGEAYFNALARYGGVDEMYCVTPIPKVFKHFQTQIETVGDRAPQPIWITPDDQAGLAEAGAIFVGGPTLPQQAWLRNQHGNQLYSICGVTHSLASDRVLANICDYLIAPLYAWDALVCTCEAARKVVLDVLEQWATYMASRGFSGKPASMVQFPVIPLGVHLERYEQTPEVTRKGIELRQELGIPDDDVVLLYFGRLDFRSKAHPTPLFRACELAQTLCGEKKTLHLLMAGQFLDPMAASQFLVAANMTALSYRTHWLDGKDTEKARSAWAAADIFISLTDNIQETFGLTPIEAMAASLPCIVSDWSGYKETVLHGVTGLRIPTMVAPPGTGQDLVEMTAYGKVDPVSYLSLTAHLTSVDVDECARAIAMLAFDSDLRHRMGKAGRQHVETHFDWKKVIRQYQGLWRELAKLRVQAAAGKPEPAVGGIPQFADPLQLFSTFSSDVLSDAHKIRLADADGRFVAARLRTAFLHDCSRSLIADLDDMNRLLDLVGGGADTVASLVRSNDRLSRNQILRTVMWMYKFGILGVDPPGVGS
jgi:alpha-maltose-1-phosphate synthase